MVVAWRDVSRERAQRVERRLVALGQLAVHVLLDQVHRHVARPFDHDLHVVFPRARREPAEFFQFAELRLVVRVRDAAGTQPVAERERHVVALHQLADLLEPGVQEVLLVMVQAPLRHDRAAARDDARHAIRRERHVAQQHAGVDREVVDALLCLLLEHFEEHLEVEVLDLALHALERLVDRHGADRHGAVAQDPLARLVQVLAGRQVHHRVGAPADGPLQLLDLFADRAAERAVADVRVDLHQEVAADDHRFDFRVVLVRGDDRAAARDLAAHELGIAVLADRDELHLLGHDAAPREVHLRVVLLALLHARIDPRLTSAGEPLLDVAALRARRVVDRDRLAVRQRDLALGDQEV